MPIIDGLDFISHIRLQDSESNTLFVIISGYDDFAYMKRGNTTWCGKLFKEAYFNGRIYAGT